MMEVGPPVERAAVGCSSLRRRGRGQALPPLGGAHVEGAAAARAQEGKGAGSRESAMVGQQSDFCSTQGMLCTAFIDCSTY